VAPPISASLVDRPELAGPMTSARMLCEDYIGEVAGIGVLGVILRRCEN